MGGSVNITVIKTLAVVAVGGLVALVGAGFSIAIGMGIGMGESGDGDQSQVGAWIAIGVIWLVVLAIEVLLIQGIRGIWRHAESGESPLAAGVDE